MKERSALFCNSCAREIKMENGILKEDVFEGNKEWGYFSEKDMMRHSFILCEACYDKMVSNFAIPLIEVEVTEL
ncbi:MAG: hypothetical protein HFH73_04375 [Lachnospiraceae bacterium]|jgi:ribosomal-protein-alanine N-acetyltransferase|nr:hypothetical protein [Lachnospiraceae bacterium]